MKRMALILAIWIAGLTAALAQSPVTVIGPVTPGNVPQFNSTNVIKDSGVPGGAGAFANPTATAGPTAINGSAVTAMRSDAAPAVQKGTNSQFGLVEGDGTTIDCSVTPGICIAKTNGVFPTPVRPGDIVYWNGSAWVTLAGNNSGTQVLAENSSGVPSWSAAGSGSVTSVACDGITITVTGTCPPRFDFVNISITASVAGNNLTIAVKDNTGADCSATSPCSVWYRDFTSAASSKWAKVDTTAALSFTANAGSTFGSGNDANHCLATTSCPFKLWIVMMNSGSGNVIGVTDLTNVFGS
jgi:hypothetical protein